MSGHRLKHRSAGRLAPVLAVVATLAAPAAWAQTGAQQPEWTPPLPERRPDPAALAAPEPAEPAEQETIGTLPGGGGFRIVYEPGATAIDAMGGRLLTGIAERMINDETIRLQIRSYAGSTPETSVRARRLSLDRAIAVRTFLVDRGVRSTRIDIRALGNTAPQPPGDRIDLLLSGPPPE